MKKDKFTPISCPRCKSESVEYDPSMVIAGPVNEVQASTVGGYVCHVCGKTWASPAPTPVKVSTVDIDTPKYEDFKPAPDLPKKYGEKREA